jgi:hypothetical protein
LPPYLGASGTRAGQQRCKTGRFREGFEGTGQDLVAARQCVAVVAESGGEGGQAGVGPRDVVGEFVECVHAEMGSVSVTSGGVG